MDSSINNLSELFQVYLSKGDKSTEAGWKIIEGLMPTIQMAAAKATNRKDVQEDLVNELCLIVFDSLDNWNPTITTIERWVWLLATRRLKYIVQRKHGDWQIDNGSKRCEGRDATLLGLSDSYEDDLESADTSDQLQSVYNAMSHVLTDRQREILLMRSNGLGVANVAARLGMQNSDVIKTYREAVRKVRQAIV